MRTSFKCFCFVFAILSFVACEKVDLSDGSSVQEEVDTEVSTDVPSGDVDTLVSELAPTSGSVFTVSQFINYTLTGEIYVKGYIVGSCQRSIKNADFEEPFEGHTAILLADRVDEQEEVIAVHPKTGTVRTALNLEDHPENCGKTLKIKGTQGTYLGTAGMSEDDVTTEYELTD